MNKIMKSMSSAKHQQDSHNTDEGDPLGAIHLPIEPTSNNNLLVPLRLFSSVDVLY